MNLKKCVLALSMLAIGIPVTARASSGDMPAKTIPAAICQPQTNEYQAKLTIVSGEWRFRPEATGYAVLVCPISANASRLSSPTGLNKVGSMRFYYRDPDGAGTATSIYGYFNQKRGDGVMSFIGRSFQSNGVVPATMLFNRVDHWLGAEHTLDWDLYFVTVSMYREPGAASPAFAGVDFLTTLI